MRSARIGGVLLLGLLSACRWGTLSPEEFEADYGAFSAVPLVGRSHFSPEGAATVAADLARDLGGEIRAMDIVVYPNSVTLTAFDPRRPDELNMYMYKDGKRWHVQPRTFDEAEKWKAFRLGDVPLEKLPQLVGEARTEFQKLRGITAYAVISRWGSGDHELRIMIHCNAPRGSGMAEFDASGRRLARH